MAFDRDAQLGALWRDGLALADAAEQAGLDAAVPCCPGWTVADLLWHTGEVHLFWRTCVAEGWEEPSAYVEPDRPLGDMLVPWYRDGVQRTVEVLTTTDADAPLWTWTPTGRTAAWVVRRMAQETAVHRWDAEAAAGEPSSIDAELAVDGVDEFFEFFTGSAVEGAAAVGGTVHLHATDADGEWLVDAGMQVRREHAKGDAAVRGTASDLLLLLWRRVGLDDDGRFEVFGDADVARRLVARSDLN